METKTAADTRRRNQEKSMVYLHLRTRGGGGGEGSDSGMLARGSETFRGLQLLSAPHEATTVSKHPSCLRTFLRLFHTRLSSLMS